MGWRTGIVRHLVTEFQFVYVRPNTLAWQAGYCCQTDKRYLFLEWDAVCREWNLIGNHCDGPTAIFGL